VIGLVAVGNDEDRAWVAEECGLEAINEEE